MKTHKKAKSLYDEVKHPMRAGCTILYIQQLDRYPKGTFLGLLCSPSIGVVKKNTCKNIDICMYCLLIQNI